MKKTNKRKIRPIKYRDKKLEIATSDEYLKVLFTEDGKIGAEISRRKQYLENTYKSRHTEYTIQ